MNHNIFIGIGTAIIGAGVIAINNTSRNERKKRAQIRANGQKEIASILYAKERVLDEINTRSVPCGFDQIMTDFDFHRIVYHNEH